MDVQTSLNRIEELFRIMYLGLWVLWAETRWIAGPDIVYQRRLTLMRRRQEAIQDELSRMATLADPRREQLAGDLALLEGDIARLEKDREERRAAPHLVAGPAADGDGVGLCVGHVGADGGGGVVRDAA